MKTYDIAVVGGGAAGFFSAINIALKRPDLSIVILEKSNKVLQKVKVSGGGRCNVTNQIWEPRELIKNYPRGGSFLLEAFNRFNSKDTLDWFVKQGVRLKIESDGRVFPQSDSSEDIINCFLNLSKELDIEVITSCGLTDFNYENRSWILKTTKEQDFITSNLVLTAGSEGSLRQILSEKKITIVPPLPSLFSFNIYDKDLQALQGSSFESAEVSLNHSHFRERGAMLITHWGISGPAVIRLSAWAARFFAEKKYKAEITIDYLSKISGNQLLEALKNYQSLNPKKQVHTNPQFGLSQKFWKYICDKSAIQNYQNWAETGKKHFQKLLFYLKKHTYFMDGKSTFKEEFVTAGGIDLNEIDPNTFRIHKMEYLYAAGEILDIDGITGGFNFQAAWTEAWIISEAINLNA